MSKVSSFVSFKLKIGPSGHSYIFFQMIAWVFQNIEFCKEYNFPENRDAVILEFFVSD